MTKGPNLSDQGDCRKAGKKKRRPSLYPRGPSYLQNMTAEELVAYFVERREVVDFYRNVSAGSQTPELEEDCERKQAGKFTRERSELLAKAFKEVTRDMAMLRQAEEAKDERVLQTRICRWLEMARQGELQKLFRGKKPGGEQARERIEALYRPVSRTEMFDVLVQEKGMMKFMGREPLPAELRKKAGPVMRWSKQKLVHACMSVKAEHEQALWARREYLLSTYKPSPDSL